MAVARTVAGRKFAWNFLKANFKECVERFKGGHLFGNIFANACSGFHSMEDAKEIEAFFSQNPVPSALRTATQTVEKIILNASWLGREKANLAKYFS